MRLGYCCINSELAEKGITTNRTMELKTFEQKGLAYAGKLAEQNLNDLVAIFNWNERHGIRVFRLSSELFPWMSKYEISELPNYWAIRGSLKFFGQLIKGEFIADIDANPDKKPSPRLRVSFHPGPYTVLASENPEVVKKSIKEINQHAEIMDLMGLPQTREYPINIHINTTAPTKEEAMKRFCDNFKFLSESAQKRLTVENDDKESQYSVKDLFSGVFVNTGVPIVIDQLHYSLGPKHDWTEKHDYGSENWIEEYKNAFILATSTWGDITPIIHMASSKLIYEDKTAKIQAHSDLIYEPILTFGQNVDVEIEAKGKEKAVLSYLDKDLQFPPVLDFATLINKYESEEDSIQKAYIAKHYFPNQIIPPVANTITVLTIHPPIIQIKKGDRVEFNEYQTGVKIGTIVKYPSNKEIHIKLDNSEIVMKVTKGEIIGVVN